MFTSKNVNFIILFLILSQMEKNAILYTQGFIDRDYRLHSNGMAVKIKDRKTQKGAKHGFCIRKINKCI